MLDSHWTEITDPPMYYDRAGQPISMLQWAWRFEDRTYRFIARDIACEGVEVSTVWLGLDHAFLSDVPAIFETMVFVTDEDVDDGHRHAGTEMYRWSSEAEAIAGHDQVVSELRGQVDVVTQPAPSGHSDCHSTGHNSPPPPSTH